MMLKLKIFLKLVRANSKGNSISLVPYAASTINLSAQFNGYS